jgi:Putative prokaryotic signal transducing protein
MIRVYSAQNTMMVDQMRDVLERQGIDSVVRSRDLSGLTGAVPSNECWTELWIVDDADAAEAEELIAAAIGGEAVDVADAAKPLRAVARHCSHCHATLEAGFDVCWRCGASGDAPPPKDFTPERASPVSRLTTRRLLFWSLWLAMLLAALAMLRAYSANG